MSNMSSPPFSLNTEAALAILISLEYFGKRFDGKYLPGGKTRYYAYRILKKHVEDTYYETVQVTAPTLARYVGYQGKYAQSVTAPTQAKNFQFEGDILCYLYYKFKEKLQNYGRHPTASTLEALQYIKTQELLEPSVFPTVPVNNYITPDYTKPVSSVVSEIVDEGPVVGCIECETNFYEGKQEVPSGVELPQLKSRIELPIEKYVSVALPVNTRRERMEAELRAAIINTGGRKVK